MPELPQPARTGYAGILLGIVTNPIYVFSQVFLNGQKMIFLVQLLLPVVFLPLLAGAAWLMAVPAFAVALAGLGPSQYSLNYHYPAIMVPFVFVLAILGLQRLNLLRAPWYSTPEIAPRRQISLCSRTFQRSASPRRSHLGHWPGDELCVRLDRRQAGWRVSTG